MKAIIPLAILLFLPMTSHADTQWSVVPYVGLSILGDQRAQANNLETGNGSIDIAVKSGFTAGLSVHYRDGSPLSGEFGWEYRSNDSTITDADGNTRPSGNYASNIFFLNARYHLPVAVARWQPWVGGGASWIQEIDLDSETLPAETSFSDSGAFGLQLMAGLDRALNDQWYLTSQLRYSNLRDLTLSEEGGGSGVISNIDYQPVTLQLGIGYRF